MGKAQADRKRRVLKWHLNVQKTAKVKQPMNCIQGETKTKKTAVRNNREQ